ncbi:hypothetical protein pb186bvf_016221 [Paramecium bursaria]
MCKPQFIAYRSPLLTYRSKFQSVFIIFLFQKWLFQKIRDLYWILVWFQCNQPPVFVFIPGMQSRTAHWIDVSIQPSLLYTHQFCFNYFQYECKIKQKSS